ncbi:MAG: MazG family protein [Oscillospiraceae bacterium]|jgi:tetrapyrrole methylase family protein/MazG family protein|nr:MazG family protein [Oscillospiraceae bacterium]
MLSFQRREKYGVYDLQKLIKLLRSPEGCPWDREQTHESIRRNLIEEAYEAAEAIDEGGAAHLREELGDVLMQVLFHADIAEDAGAFGLDDVADATVRKLLYRHPHVFGDAVAETSGAVLESWDELKRVEKSQLTVTDSLRAVAKSLPALWRAEKVLKKAAKAGFTVADFARNHSDKPDGPGAELLALAERCLRDEADPEDALTAAVEEFIAAFETWETAADN